MDGSKKPKFAVDAFAKNVFGLLVAATKASNALPEGDEYTDVALTAPAVATRLADMGQQLTRLMSETGRKRRGAQDFVQSPGAEEGFDKVVDAVDGWLEGVDRTVDRLSGVAALPGALTVTKDVLKSNITVIRAANVLRPQLKFYPPIDNSAAVPFVPHLTSKPHALVPLPEVFRAGPARHESAISVAMQSHLTARGGGGGAVAGHPYEHELQALQFGPEHLTAVKERIFGVPEQTPWSWIDTPAALDILIGKLAQEKEIAVDLEQHYFRSYQGFVCLMQISTRTEDFLVDALELRPHMQRLNVVFANPNIVKVLHGADFDIQWLQRDFGLYVVNLFDTGQAARVLDYQKKSLAYLLDEFCNVQANKQYQLADWRIRPLPEEMTKYAVEDTHYLLYIWDRLRNELAAKSSPESNLILNVLNRSRQLCLQVYQKPPAVTPTSHEEVFEKIRAQPLTGVKLDAFVELYRWRDELARQEDESPAFVLPNRMLYSVGELLPSSVEQMLSLCVPVPPLARAYAHEITAIVHRARSGTIKTAGARGFYSIAALLKPIAPAVLAPTSPAAAAAATVALPTVPESLKPQLHPANAQGKIAPRTGGLFGTTLEQDTKKHSAAVAASLKEIGKSLDPLFASRVAEAFEEPMKESKTEEKSNKRPLEEQQNPVIEVEEVEEEGAGAFPKSLADIHRLTQRNKRTRKKKDKQPGEQLKPASPLDYGKLGSSVDNPVNLDDSPSSFVRNLGLADVPDFSKKTAPVPSGTNRLEALAKEKKSKTKEDSQLQGFDVSSQVASAKKARKREQPGGQIMYVREADKK